MVHRHRTPSAFPVSTVGNPVAFLRFTAADSLFILGGPTRLSHSRRPITLVDHPVESGRPSIVEYPATVDDTFTHTSFRQLYFLDSIHPSSWLRPLGPSTHTSRRKDTALIWRGRDFLMFDDDQHSHLPWRGDGDSHSPDDIVQTGSRSQCCAGDDFSRRPTDDMQPVAHSSIFRGCIPIDLC